MKTIEAAADAAGNPHPPPAHLENLELGKQAKRYNCLMYLKHNCFEVTTPPNHNLKKKIVLRRFFVTDTPIPEDNCHFAILRLLLLKVVQHIKAVHENAPIHREEDYKKTRGG